MTLRSKLLLAQLPLALSLLVVGVVSRRTVATLQHSSQDILKDNHLSVLAAQRMRNLADEISRAALATALGQPASARGELAQKRAAFERELTFQEGNITEAGEGEQTQRARAQWSTFQRVLDAVMTAPQQKSQVTYFQDLEPALRELKQAAAEITTMNQDAMVRKSESAHQAAQRMGALMLGVTAVAFLLGILSSVYLTNRLIRPLTVLTHAVRRLGQGDLATRARLGGQDEIAQMAHEFNTMAERLFEYRRSSLGELLAAQQASQAAIDSLPDPVLVLATSGELLNANEAAATLFSIAIESPGKAAFAQAPKEVLAIVAKMKEHIAAGKGAYVPKSLDAATPVELRDGTRYFLARANPVAGEGAQTVGLTILFQDVTRLRRFDELKTDMVATVAHEFRTPLTSLRMAIHMCAEGLVGALTPKQADLLFAAREDCERLQGIVDDLLDLSRIQAGKVELHRRAVSSASLLAHAVDEHRQRARERHIDLVLSKKTSERQVFADPDRVQLVLDNLITNAIRHTPAEGLIEVSAHPEDGVVRYEVTDTGPGIPSEYIPRLFERFFQIPGSAGGGAGLGLYICKEVVEAHGGRVGVENRERGQGATFFFTLPTVQK